MTHGYEFFDYAYVDIDDYDYFAGGSEEGFYEGIVEGEEYDVYAQEEAWEGA